MRLAALPALLILLVVFPSAYAQPDSIELLNSDYAFVDVDGMTNIVGVINNKGMEPISAVIAIDVSNGTTIYEEPYAQVLFPGTGAPFKFRLHDGLHAEGKPYVESVQKVDRPFYDTLVFTYSNMAVGEERALIGSVKNIGSFAYYNVTVFASVHDDKMTQIDSSRSNVISVIEPGQVAEFRIVPDEAIMAQTMYYSCAGWDPTAPLPTVSTGDGNYISYMMETVSKISRFRYDNSTDSLTFGITPYIPAGAPVSLQFAQSYENQTIAVFVDNVLQEEATVMLDGKTAHVTFFVPPGNHEVQVQGIRAVSEFPFAALGLAAVTAAVIATTRFRAAFKIL
jgi:hypothetical protein